MLKFIVLLTVYFMSSISMLEGISQHENICRSPHHKYGDELVRIISEELCERYNLKLTGVQTAMMYRIEKIGFSFRCFDNLDIATARKFFVESMGYIMEVVEQLEIPSDYLKGGKLSESDFTIMIISEEVALGADCEGELLGAVLSAGTIKYRACDNIQYCGFTEVLRESYEEACDLIAGLGPKIGG